MKQIKEIFRNIKIKSENVNNNINIDIKIDNLQYDSRMVSSGTMFFALRGATTDGHKYIEKAIELGAVAIVCEDNSLSTKYPHINFFEVEDSRKALALCSHNFYNNPTKDMKVIGITGTNGKTTTTFLIADMLNQFGHKTAIIGTTGIYIGSEFVPATHTTPESLELAQHFRNMADQNVEYVIMETSSHALSQHRTAGIDFYAGLFTNLTHEHLDYHKTMREYAKAKKILFDNLSENSIAVVFNTSEYSTFLLDSCRAIRKYYIGHNNNADIIISDKNLKFDYSEFSLSLNQTAPIKFTTKLIGGFNIENASLAVSYMLLSGFQIDETIGAMAKANGAPGRMDRIILKNKALAIIDYAHTPDALDNALKACREILNQIKTGGKLICVFGCGGDRDNSKRPVMGDISTRLADFTFITDDNPRTELSDDIIRQIAAGIEPKYIAKYKVISDRKSAIKSAVEFSKPGDIILIAGKGHENYQIIGTTKHHFDDKEIVLSIHIIIK